MFLPADVVTHLLHCDSAVLYKLDVFNIFEFSVSNYSIVSMIIKLTLS